MQEKYINIINNMSKSVWSKIVTICDNWKYLWVVFDGDLDILRKITASDVEIFCIFVWCKKNKLSGRLHGFVKKSFVNLNIYILNILWDWSFVDVDGGITIEKWLKKVSGHLLEESLVIWKKIQVKNKPLLNISSSDIEASHWAKIERIDAEKKFYMQSKWLWETVSVNMIVDGYLENIFSKFENNILSTVEIVNIKKKIFTKINN